MVKQFDCGLQLDKLFNQEKFKKLPDETQSDIARRVEQRNAQHNAVSSTPAKTETAPLVRFTAESRFERIMRMTNQAQLLPGNARGLQYLMARHFNIGRVGAGLVGKLTDAGAVKKLIHKVGKFGSGNASDLLADIQLLDRNLQLERQFRGIRARHNIPLDDWNRLKLDLIEVGTQPYTQEAFGIVGPEGIEFLRGRQKSVFDRMKSMGIPESTQQQLASVAKQSADTYHEVLEVIQGFGVKAGDADGLIRYFPREISANAVRNIHWERAGKRGFNILDINGGSNFDSVSTVFTKARNSNHFIVEDAIVLDEALKAADPKIYDKLGVVDIDDVISDTHILTKAFVTHLDNSAPDLFDALVDTGMISKIPMTTTELFEATVEKYQLPFKHLNEFVATDLGEASEIYRNNLRRSVGRSTQAHFVAKASIEGGWGVTEAERLADMDRFGDFIQLSSPDAGKLDVVIPAGQAQQFGMPVFQHSHVYVHPTVGKMFQAELRLASNPAHLGSLGRLIDANYRLFRQVLFSPDYAFRQIYSPAFQTFAAGGRPDRYFADFMQAMVNSAKLRRAGKTFDQYHTLLDDTAKIYRDGNRLLSERELWREARRRGALDDVLPWGSRAGGRSTYTPKFNPQRSIAYLQHLGASFSDIPGRILELPSMALEAVSDITSPINRQLGLINNFADNVGRFSAIKTRLDISPSNRAARIASGGSASDTLDDAIDVVNEFFFDYSQSSTLDNVAQYVIPFWRFRSRNPPAILKMVIRNPSKFMAYQRLWAAFNEPERDEIIQGAVPEWATGWTDMVWRDNLGNIFSLPRASFDPIAEGADTLAGLARLLGVDDSPYTSLDEVPWAEKETARWFREAVNSSFGWIKAVYATAFGRSPATGRMLKDEGRVGRSFLGVDVPPLTKYIVENMFPITARLDRSNPFGVFGTPTTYNPDGTVKELAQPSWAGVPGDQRSKVSRFEAHWQKMLSVVGVNVYQFREFDQLGFTEDDIVFAIQEGRRAYNEANRNLRLDWNSLSRGERERRLAELYLYRDTVIKLMLDHARLTAWGKERGMDFSGAVRYTRRNNRAVESFLADPKELERAMESMEDLMPLPRIPIN